MDQLLARIDSLLTTTKRHAASDLHLRVMDLLDNPTQHARLHNWDIETFEVTAQDRIELDWLDGFCSGVFVSPHQRGRSNMHSPCVVCDVQPSIPEYNNLFCSPYCALEDIDTDPQADGPSSYYFDNFYSQHNDLPKPLYTSNVCVAPMCRLKD